MAVGNAFLEWFLLDGSMFIMLEHWHSELREREHPVSDRYSHNVGDLPKRVSVHWFAYAPLTAHSQADTTMLRGSSRWLETSQTTQERGFNATAESGRLQYGR
jgi:hypothetical protein